MSDRDHITRYINWRIIYVADFSLDISILGEPMEWKYNEWIWIKFFKFVVKYFPNVCMLLKVNNLSINPQK